TRRHIFEGIPLFSRSSISHLGHILLPAAWFCLLAGRMFSQSIITTVAGTDFLFGDDGKDASEAQFGTLDGVLPDGQGNIYVADASTNQIWTITPGGVATVYAGTGQAGFGGDGGPARNAIFSSPLGLAIDSSDNLYVADAVNGRVRKITAEGIVSTVAGGGI